MIKIVDGKPYLDQVKALIIEYTEWLGRCLLYTSACDDAIEEIKNVVRIIRNEFSGTRVYITADHGFLYTYSPLSEDSKEMCIRDRQRNTVTESTTSHLTRW